MAQMLPVQSAPNYSVVTSSLPSMGGWPPTTQAQSEDGFSAAVLLGMLRRHWLLIASILAVAFGAAYGVTRMTRPVYRASTTLYFAEHESSIPALDVLNEIENGNSEVATEMQVMRSRALAETVADSLGLQVTAIAPWSATSSAYFRVLDADKNAGSATFEFKKSGANAFLVHNVLTNARIGVAAVNVPFTFGGATIVLSQGALETPAFEIQVRSRQTAVADLLRKLDVSRPNPSASVVQISYTSNDPQRTREVPDVLAKMYLQWRSGLRKSGDRSTVVFLKEQIDTIARQLFVAEEALRRFRQENQVVDLPTQATTEVQRLATLEAAQADVDMQRVSLKNLMREVKSAPPDPRLGSPYRRLMAFPALMTASNPALPLLQTLTGLEQRRSDLLVRRTPADPDVAAVNVSIADAEGQIAAVVDTYVKGLDEQAASLASQIAQFRGAATAVPQKEIEYARLDRTQSGLAQIYTMLQTRFREAQIAEAVDDGSVRVVDPAATPILPIAPRPALNLLLGGLLGLLVAIGAVTLAEHLDRTIHTKEEVETISNSPVLALIPHISAEDKAKSFRRWVRIRPISANGNNGSGNRGSKVLPGLISKDPQSLASEAYRKLRTNITFARPDSPPRVLVFTSPAPGDGKSTSVINLAIALLQQGKKVIVIDADMRRGGLHKMLRAVQTPGLSEILVGQSYQAASVQSLSIDPFGAVDFLSTGVIPPNPAELLASPRFRGLVESLRPMYDAILIDSPPVNSVIDASIIGRETDGAVFVVRAGKSTRAEIAHAIGQLRQVQVPITGLILNDYDAKRAAGYNAQYYGYAYDYRPYAAQS